MEDKLNKIDDGLRGIASSVDYLLGGQIALLSEADIVEYLAIRGIIASFTRISDDKTATIEVGFPFTAHEENVKQNLTMYYTSGFQNIYNNPARVFALRAIEEYVKQILEAKPKDGIWVNGKYYSPTDIEGLQLIANIYHREQSQHKTQAT